MSISTEKRLAIEHDLRESIQGDVLFDQISRVLYSTDASNFQIEPLGVVLPRHIDEINAIVEIAQSYAIPVIPRGSGSSMAGQTLGRGLILDCSKYLNSIEQIDPERKIAIVEPGVILDELNRQLRVHGLTFGPDPASAERATVGGMIGNNATGAHSIQYGLVIDHVVRTDVTLSNGSTARFESLSDSLFQQRVTQDNLEGSIYRTMASIIEQYAPAVHQHWPGTWRRASGYSLNYLTGYTPNQPPVWYEKDGRYPPTAGNNLAALMVGAEGTLAILRKATLNLVPLPKAKALAILSFNSVAEAAEATPGLLQYEPDAIELIPRTIFERARSIPAYARKMGFLEGDPAAILVIEFSASTEEGARACASRIPDSIILDRHEEQADLWAVRKVGLGLLMSIPGDTKPITFIEDVAIPVESLGKFVREVEEILSEQGTSGEWYAHASAGCLHLRPLVNLKTSHGVNQMRDIAEAVIDLTLSLNGSISGEHGDGLSHTEYNHRLFGPEIMQAFRQIKSAFDPEELLNPGKVIPASDGFGGAGSLTRDLRFGPAYQTIETISKMAHRREGSFAAAIEACTGIGVCRKEQGLMCPSYQATRDEIDSTRGRANALRAAIAGILPDGALTSKELYQVLDLCLECKGCKAECPTAVDMARLKAEFLYLYQQEHGGSLRSRVFADIHQLARVLHPFGNLIRWVGDQQWARFFQEALLGVSRERSLPMLNRHPFQMNTPFSHGNASKDGPRVILFLDTYTKYMQPHLGHDAVFVLNSLGYDVELVPGQVCCGRPMISKGRLDHARKHATKNIEVLGPPAEEGVPILGLEPSCLLTLRDEYLEFFPHEQRAHSIARQSFLMEEFLLTERVLQEKQLLDGLSMKEHQPVSFHNHCYSKALVGSETMQSVFEGIGVDAIEIPSGCCGMAGSFGYEEEHYALSMQIAEQVLLPEVRQAQIRGRMILAPGFSCRTQIRDGSAIEALHPIEYIASLLRESVTTPKETLA
jgi:FAD/FMN-containing dehydrogenase/Fe-S oxidoreductase